MQLCARRWSSMRDAPNPPYRGRARRWARRAAAARLVEQRLGQRDAGLLSGGEPTRGAVEKIVQDEILGEPRDFLLARGDAIKHRENQQILPNRESMRHVDIGAFEIHAAQHARPIGRHVGAERANVARGRLDQPHDHADRRGLAGPVAAQQRRHRTRGKREVQRPDDAPAVVGFGKPPHREGFVGLGRRHGWGFTLARRTGARRRR